MLNALLNKIDPRRSVYKSAYDLFAERLFLPHEDAQRRIAQKVAGKTMIGSLGVLANLDAVDYIAANEIQGCIVECGVWKGGSVAAMLYRLIDHGMTDRAVYLYDTFAGMTAPTALDKKGNVDVLKKFQDSQASDHNEWCYSSLDEVKRNIAETDYPSEKIHYVQGDVLKTLPENTVPPIALLRLDTDWYESTKAEMEHLYPKVAIGGIVIIDDYGAWEGARKAIDEYFAEHDIRPLMARIDQTRRVFIKQK